MRNAGSCFDFPAAGKFREPMSGCYLPKLAINEKMRPPGGGFASEARVEQTV